ncbi:MAG: N-acetylglucosamine-6-phosphate deacetylase [Blastocatellia bacterium]
MIDQNEIYGNIPGAGYVCLRVEGGSIVAIDSQDEERPEASILSPGWTDLQVNGLGGIDFSDPGLEPEQVLRVLPLFWKTGVTSFCPTLITHSQETLVRNFRVLETARKTDARFAAAVPCYHLEGPYISPLGSRGAHNQDYLRLPNWTEFSELQEAAGGNIGVITLAPELLGAIELIERAAASGVIVAIGHTDGGREHIHAAVKAGARLSTHLGNGCPPLIDRHHNPIWPQLALDELSATIICDTFHLPSDLVRIILRIKGIERLILVTDAVHVTLLPPGEYKLSGIPIELQPDGKVVRIGDSCFAGSSLTMDRAIPLFMRLSGATLEDGLRAAGRNPVELLGRAGLCAALAPGQPANVVSFGFHPDALSVDGVWLMGERVY